MTVAALAGAIYAIVAATSPRNDYINPGPAPVPVSFETELTDGGMAENQLQSMIPLTPGALPGFAGETLVPALTENTAELPAADLAPVTLEDNTGVTDDVIPSLTDDQMKELGFLP